MTRHWRGGPALLSIAVLVLAACGGGESTPTVAITATEYSFTIDPEVPAGPVTLTLTNDGAAEHHAQLLRLNDGVTMDDLGAALATEDVGALFAVSTPEGGVGVQAPDTTSSAVTVDLTPGNYVLACFITDDDGVPHLAKGMLQPFEVTGTDDADLPAAEGTIVGTDFAFELPADFDGDGTFRFENRGEQVHEVNVIALPPEAAGITREQVLAALTGEAGPPPFELTSAGGGQAILPGAAENVEFDLDTGTYLLICFVPDPTSGAPHAALGMVEVVQVE